MSCFSTQPLSTCSGIQWIDDAQVPNNPKYLTNIRKNPFFKSTIQSQSRLIKKKKYLGYKNQVRLGQFKKSLDKKKS